MTRWLLPFAFALVACSGATSSAVTENAATDAEAGAPRACGGAGGIVCAEDEYCDFALEAACGSAAQTGTCKTMPSKCRLIADPVCGCDGKTYGNACMANVEGVSVAKAGECSGHAGSGTACGGGGGASCPVWEWCAYSIHAACGDSALAGTCEGKPAEPLACNAAHDPVCGCDGKTYGNACEAHAAQTSVRARGECPK